MRQRNGNGLREQRIAWIMSQPNLWYPHDKHWFSDVEIQECTMRKIGKKYKDGTISSGLREMRKNGYAVGADRGRRFGDKTKLLWCWTLTKAGKELAKKYSMVKERHAA